MCNMSQLCSKYFYVHIGKRCAEKEDGSGTFVLTLGDLLTFKTGAAGISSFTRSQVQ